MEAALDRFNNAHRDKFYSLLQRPKQNTIDFSDRVVAILN
jgi:hypothetical protein